MSFEEVKAAAAALPREDRDRLVDYLVCLGVTEDPEWMTAVHASMEGHAGRYERENAPTTRVAEEP